MLIIIFKGIILYVLHSKKKDLDVCTYVDNYRFLLTILPVKFYKKHSPIIFYALSFPINHMLNTCFTSLFLYLFNNQNIYCVNLGGNMVLQIKTIISPNARIYFTDTNNRLII